MNLPNIPALASALLLGLSFGSSFLAPQSTASRTRVDQLSRTELAELRELLAVTEFDLSTGQPVLKLSCDLAPRNLQLGDTHGIVGTGNLTVGIDNSANPGAVPLWGSNNILQGVQFDQATWIEGDGNLVSAYGRSVGFAGNGNVAVNAPNFPPLFTGVMPQRDWTVYLGGADAPVWIRDTYQP